MATTLKLRRGTTAEHATFTGAVGEVTVDTDKDVVVVHDGATAGGFPAIRAGGALGTPSSGTVTNLTGTASININGTVGATTPAAGSFTSLTDSGNLTFTGTGNRITGDFSNATIANRVAFQSSTTNGATTVFAAPNGTSATAGFFSTNSSSDPANGSEAQIQINATEMGIISSRRGTGTFLPMTFYIGGSERMRIDTSGNVGIGTSSPSAKLQVVGNVMAGNGTAATPAYHFVGSSAIGMFTPDAGFSVAFSTASTERMRIDSSGNVGIGTSSPGAKLDVASNANALQITPASGATGTAACFATFRNNNRIFYIGNDSSTGASFGAADASVMWNSAAAPLLFATSNTERARIDSSGNLLIGKTTTDNATNGISWGGGVGTVVYAGGAGDGPQIQVVNTTASGTVPNGFRYLSFRLGATATEIGTITKASATTVAYNTSSDYRLKENIQPMTGALAKVQALKPCTYTWKEDGSNGQGFIAHELQAVVPDCVTGKKDGVEADGVTPRYQGVDTSFLVATLTAAIQELKAELDATKAEVAALKGA